MNEMYWNLVDMLNKIGRKGIPDYHFEAVANYLLENGVIVLPCKVGDIVYEIRTGKVLDFEVYSIEIYDDIEEDLYIMCENNRIFNINDFGKTVFLTKEEAEKHLGGVQE